MRKLALITTALLALSGCSSQTGVEIANAWVKSSEMSVQGGMTAIFGTITNHSSEDITLVGAKSDSADLVEIHEMADSGGETVMQKLEGGLTIPAGQSVELEPGGNHIMLMNLTADVLAGDSLSVTLDFEGAPDQVIEVTAKPTQGGDEEYHSGDMGH